MVKYYVSREKRLVLEKFEDEVTFDLIERAALAIWANPDYDKKHKALIDIRNCEVKIGYKDVPRIANFFLRNANSAIGYVIVLANSNQSIAKSFMFKSNVIKLMNIHVMSDFEEALNALQIDESFYNLINSNQAFKIPFESNSYVEV